MRLPDRILTRPSARFPARFWALGLTAVLAACGRGGDEPMSLVSATEGPVAAQYGPAGDYPVVVGEPYYIGETLFTPVDTMNYDEVGYAMADPAGSGITVAHRTLPMPSYVEVTALDSGKTILARVERRGPMAGNGVAGLSAGAMRQLEAANGAPIRIRRVNSAEVDRAKLRSGEAAPARMDTPKSLLAVLKRKLPEAGTVSLAVAQPAAPELAPKQAQTQAKSSTPEPKMAQRKTAPETQFEQAFSDARKVATAYPLAPIGSAKPTAEVQTITPPKQVSAAATPTTEPQARTAQQPVAEGNFVIQAATFSNKGNADRLANSIDGFVQKSGQFYRVRKGPFANRGQAEAALAKLRAAGYSDARVFTAG